MMRSTLQGMVSQDSKVESLFAEKMAEVREMRRELERLKEQIERTEQLAREHGLIGGHSR